MRTLAIRYLAILFSMPAGVYAQKDEILFKVNFKGDDIGTLVAFEERSGERRTRDLRSITDAKVMVIAIHVESEISSTHENGTFIKSTAYRHSNRGSQDVHSQVTRMESSKYKCERNGTTHIESREITFSIVDLYFKEPSGLTEVFSTMYADFLPIQSRAPGEYIVTTPDNMKAWYSYKDGKLIKIESETPLGTVVSTRE